MTVFFYQLDAQILYLIHLLHSTGYESPLVACVLNGHPKIATIPEAVLI